jgi:hypothetical protein
MGAKGITLTDYAVEDITSKHGHTGTLYKRAYIVPSALEGLDELQPKFFSLQRSSIPSALTYLPSTAAETWGDQGLVTVSDFLNVTTNTKVSNTGYLVQWTPSESFDLRNIAISNLGQGVRNLLWMDELADTFVEVQQNAQAKSVLLSDEVQTLCERYRLSSYLQRALRLARQTFLSLKSIEVTAQNDPETDDEWVAIVVQIHGEVRTVLDMYDDYTTKLVDSIPWPARDKIRLIYDLI